MLFDRGIAKTGTFVEFDEKEYKFITRMHLKRRYDIIRENEITQKQQPRNFGGHNSQSLSSKK
ncbi:hypothetical protein [Wolbachia endosymbiont of Oedothorax gibbosus]|uniref:hypothetical protein n=1 Tax=Wolbachia endosymbiont of Oedothorax gibbosus TaxID=931100 RepID=UPI002023BEDF|nr:hypothetical protein [Wolbachia endosymbiont of Oedothorax gibbosus]